jgi:hypothetical protein
MQEPCLLKNDEDGSPAFIKFSIEAFKSEKGEDGLESYLRLERKALPAPYRCNQRLETFCRRVTR